ncbi:hypothetical protein OFP26_29335, partial [Escherichia coli]|nr:hypothetical protein [Escherichia coli]
MPSFSSDRSDRHPLIIMGGAASFLNPEPIAEFTDVIAVGEGEILAPQLIGALFESGNREELLLNLARIGRGFYVPAFYDVKYDTSGIVKEYIPNREGIPRK